MLRMLCDDGDALRDGMLVMLVVLLLPMMPLLVRGECDVWWFAGNDDDTANVHILTHQV